MEFAVASAEATANSIAVTAPAPSAQDPDASVEYAISEDGETYSAWQSSPLFENLKPDWEYFIVARYVAADTVFYTDSDASYPFPQYTLDDSASYVPKVIITVGDATVQHGDEAVLPITFEHNLTDAEFKKILLSFVVENDLTEENVQLISGGDRNRYLGEALAHDPFANSNGYFVLVGGYNGLSHSYELAYCKSGTYNSPYTLPQGEIFKLYVKIAENAVPGEYTVGLETKESPKTPAFSAEHYLYGTLNDKVTVEVNAGTVTVVEPLAAPVLTSYTAADDSVTIIAPALPEGASHVEYAISADGETYGEWTADNVFGGLSEKTVYYVIARYISADRTKIGDSYASELLTVETVNPTVTYMISSAETKAGETIQIPVTLEHTVTRQATGFSLIPETDGLELIGVTAGSALNEGWKVMLSDGVVTVYRTEPADIPVGQVVILTLNVPENAEKTSYTVTLSRDFGEDGNCFVGSDDTVLRVDGTVEAGTVTVKKILFGDIDRNGEVTVLDMVSLRRYLAEWDSYTAETLDLEAADVYADGSVTMADAIVLSRHLADWPDYKQLPYTPAE